MRDYETITRFAEVRIDTDRRAHDAAKTMQLEARVRDLEGQLARVEDAVQSNRDIAVAIGVLMAGRGVDRDSAFGLLRSASQRSQIKLRRVACDFLRTGQLP